MLYPFIEVILFTICIVFAFYLPGQLLTTKLNLKTEGLSQIFISIISGLILFTLFSYILSWVHLEILILPIIVIADVILIREGNFLPKIKKNELLPLGYITMSALIFSIPLLIWGIWGNQIMYGLDDVWHLSLIQELKVNFPPNIPSFSGVELRGYHLFYDLLASKISNLFFISPFSLHFHLLSVFIAFMWGLGIFVLMYDWTKKTSAGYVAVFLSMFGGSLAFILHLQGHPEVDLADGIGMLQPSTSIYNPPYSISVVILFFCLFLLRRYLSENNRKWMIPFMIAAGLLPMFKVYAGIILYAGFLFVVLIETYKRKFFLWGVTAVIGIIYMLTFWVFIGSSGGLLWHPYWSVPELLRNFKWYGYDEKMYTYKNEGVIKGIIETQAYGFVVFYFWNLGVRLLGILLLPLLLLKKKRFPDLFSLSVVIMFLVSILVPTFFLQTGKVFEIIQMANYYLLFGSILGAIGFAALFSLKYKFRMVVNIIVVLIIFLTCFLSPYTAYSRKIKTLSTAMSTKDSYHTALSYLKSLGSYNDVVLDIPPLGVVSDQDIRFWYNSTVPVVSALSNKRTYLERTNLDSPGMDYKKRTARLEQFFAEISDLDRTREFLDRNNITYIFSPYGIQSMTHVKGVKQVYGKDYYIYKVDR